MATFFLIRHAACEGLGYRINGRMQGVLLTEKGKQEAQQLAERLAHAAISAIYSSPLERAQATTQAIANRLNLSWQTDNELNEIDYGEWTGKRYEELKDLPEWKEYNSRRCSAQIPGGESMRELVERVRLAVTRIAKQNMEQVVAVVSHGDWIRAAVTGFIGVSLDQLRRFQVDPASVSVLRVEDWGATLVRWNDTGPIENVS
jgi:broad specificity phosphatase PhoE